jgi:hypothetical protein
VGGHKRGDLLASFCHELDISTVVATLLADGWEGTRAALHALSIILGQLARLSTCQIGPEMVSHPVAGLSHFAASRSHCSLCAFP